MTKAQAERIIKAELLPHVDGWVARGDLAVKDDELLILRGVLLNRSQLDKHTVDVLAFAQNLSLEDEEVTFGISAHLGRFKVGAGDDHEIRRMRDAVMRDGMRFLDRFDGYSEYAQEVEGPADLPMDREYRLELAGYGWVLDGEMDRAQSALERAMELEEKQGERSLIPPRVLPVIDLLATDPAQAQRLLRERADHTIEAIRLPPTLAVADR